MAESSEKFLWKLFPGARKRCWECGREPLRVEDVAQERRVYPRGTYEFLCVTCADARTWKAIRRTRESLGLEAGEAPPRFLSAPAVPPGSRRRGVPRKLR